MNELEKTIKRYADAETKQEGDALLREMIELERDKMPGGDALAGLRDALDDAIAADAGRDDYTGPDYPAIARRLVNHPDAQAAFKNPAPDAATAKMRMIRHPLKSQRPQAVIERRPPNSAARHAFLRRGDIGILSGAGGAGKSMTTLDLALTATLPGLPADAHGMRDALCGLHIRPGPVVAIQYEDAPAEIDHRIRAYMLAREALRWMRRQPHGATDADAWNRIGNRDALLPNIYTAALETLRNDRPPGQRPPPSLYSANSELYILETAGAPALYAADPMRRGTATATAIYRQVWQAVRDIRPVLIVIDPVSAALHGASVSEPGPVRDFIGGMARDAAAMGADAPAILLVAHDTKAARQQVAKNEPDAALGADAIAGSATWYDAARGVLYLYPDAGNADRRSLVCIKSNYGPATRGPDGGGWPRIDLEPTPAGGTPIMAALKVQG